MSKICVDARMALHSGIGTYIRNLLPSIRKEFPSLQVLAPLSLAAHWPELEKFNLIPVQTPIYSLREQWEIPFKMMSCNLFWSPHYNTPLLPLRAKKRIVTIHDVCHLACSNGFVKRVYAELMIRHAARCADHLVTVSSFSKKEIIRATGVSQEKLSVIPNGVDRRLFSFPLSPSKLHEVSSIYSLPENYMLFVSALAPHKNLNRLLKAWNKVTQKHVNWHLMLVGKKKGQEFLEKTVRHLGDVSESDLPALYQNARALIYPSLYEGFGLPPLEAMAMHCPTIVSSAASLPEVCGEASLYVDPYSEEDIALKISTLIENPALRQTLIEKGLQRVDHLNWEKSVQSHLEIIHRML